MNRKNPPFLTRVDEFLVGYGVTIGFLDPFLHVCNCIFPLSINLRYEVNRISMGLFGRKIPGIFSAGVF